MRDCRHAAFPWDAAPREMPSLERSTGRDSAVVVADVVARVVAQHKQERSPPTLFTGRQAFLMVAGKGIEPLTRGFSVSYCKKPCGIAGQMVR